MDTHTHTHTHIHRVEKNKHLKRKAQLPDFEAANAVNSN